LQATKHSLSIFFSAAEDDEHKLHVFLSPYTFSERSCRFVPPPFTPPATATTPTTQPTTSPVTSEGYTTQEKTSTEITVKPSGAAEMKVSFVVMMAMIVVAQVVVFG
jgi:hypothetical protein